MTDVCCFAMELTGHTVHWEDMLYNCLDFCVLNRLRPHVYLSVTKEAQDAPLWELLEVLRQEKISFSLLTEPERSRYEAAYPDTAFVRIASDGTACCGKTRLGNLLEDRLADLWVTAAMDREGIA